MPSRPALEPPDGRLASNCAVPRTICFRHPAYPASSTPDLVRLSAADGDDYDGLDFDVAVVVCSIVSGIQWDKGFLSRRTDDKEEPFARVERPADGVLRDDVYYWCCEGSDPVTDRYPVYPSFQHWRFPHGALPPPWSRLSLPDFTPWRPETKGAAAALERDVSCRISGFLDACEEAHLVPSSELDWFISNRMDQYLQDHFEPFPIHNDGNLIVLRRDLHFLFDRNRFAFIPKISSSARAPDPPSATDPIADTWTSTSAGDEQVQVAIHVLRPDGSAQLVQQYHNRATQPLRGVSPEMLFARFAFSIFRDETMPFLKGPEQFAVWLWDVAGGWTEEALLSSSEIRDRAHIFDVARSRSKSRSVSQESQEEGHEVYSDTKDACSVDHSAEEEEQGNDAEELDMEQETRGRKRYRSRDFYLSLTYDKYRAKWPSPSDDGQEGEHEEACDQDGAEQPVQRDHEEGEEGGDQDGAEWTLQRDRDEDMEEDGEEHHGGEPPSLGTSLVSATESSSSACTASGLAAKKWETGNGSGTPLLQQQEEDEEEGTPPPPKKKKRFHEAAQDAGEQGRPELDVHLSQ